MEFNVDEWYRRYYRYPEGSTVLAPHEIHDVIKAYKLFLLNEHAKYEQALSNPQADPEAAV